MNASFVIFSTKQCSPWTKTNMTKRWLSCNTATSSLPMMPLPIITLAFFMGVCTMMSVCCNILTSPTQLRPTTIGIHTQCSIIRPARNPTAKKPLLLYKKRFAVLLMTVTQQRCCKTYTSAKQISRVPCACRTSSNMLTVRTCIVRCSDTGCI